MSTAAKRNESCEDRIEDRLSSRVDDVRELLDGMTSDDDETREKAMMRAHEDRP